jgi:preprotein translocase subunit YajC
MRIILSSLSLAIAAALPVQPAFAQAASVAAGAKVSDTNGGEVGTVTSVDGEFVIVKTDKHEVRLPANSFTATESGLLFGMTQAQLNAEIEKAKINPVDLLKAGAEVRDTAGGLIGTIEAVEGDLATVKLAKLSVKLPVSVFGAGPDGLVLGTTAAELEAQAAAAGGAAN